MAAQVGIVDIRATQLHDDSISFHAFPLNNKEILDKWMRANPADFIPTK